MLRFEAIFRTAKSILETRSTFHRSDTPIAGHLICSFLALLLRKELDERLSVAGITAEWNDIVRDLDRVEQVNIEQGPNRFVLGPQAPSCASAVFKAVGVVLPSFDPADPYWHATTRRAAATEWPRTPPEWCHVALNFLISRYVSDGW